jgi:hypothetical protein
LRRTARIRTIEIDHATRGTFAAALLSSAFASTLAGPVLSGAAGFGAGRAGRLLLALRLGRRHFDGLTLGAGLGLGFGSVALGLLVFG